MLEVAMLRLADGAVVASATVPNNPRTIAVAPRGDRIFVVEHEEDELYAFDVVGETLSLAASTELESEPGCDPIPVHVVTR